MALEVKTVTKTMDTETAREFKIMQLVLEKIATCSDNSTVEGLRLFAQSALKEVR